MREQKRKRNGQDSTHRIACSIGSILTIRHQTVCLPMPHQRNEAADSSRPCASIQQVNRPGGFF
jgi:hypothetical protein